MTSRRRGYALIINNINFSDDDYPVRNGAENDEVRLTDLLEQLYFTVERHRDKTRKV